MGGIRQLGNLGEVPEADCHLLHSSLHTAQPYSGAGIPQDEEGKGKKEFRTEYLENEEHTRKYVGNNT